MIQTMFLCAGLGTRLLPLTRELPKPMVPIGDRPVLSRLCSNLVQAGGALRAVNTHHLPGEIRDFVATQDPAIEVFHEPELLGTAGGIKGAISAFAATPLVVWNSDIETKPNLEALLGGLERARLALAIEPLKANEGNVGMDASGRVVRLRQYSVATEVSGGNYVGILAMRPDCFGILPPRGCLIGDLAMQLLRQSEGVVGVAHRRKWRDIGSLRDYLAANLQWLEEQCAGQSYIGSSAHIDSAVQLNAAVIGKGATVRGRGSLDRVVVWPGATCSAPLSDAIVTRAGTVVQVT